MQLNQNVSEAHLNDIEIALHRSADRLAMFSDPDFLDRLRARLFANPETEVWSLDIFDTVLLRDNSSELTRFFEIGAAMAEIVNQSGGLKKCGAVDAFFARHMGTKATYRGSDTREGCVEGSLEEIHTVASRLISGDAGFAKTFIEAELAYETTRLCVNKALLDLIKEFKSQGGSVILMSDMYMHGVHIEVLLKNSGADLSMFHKIFSSADLKFSKHSGRAYPHIEKELGIDARNILHIGDNFHSDFVRAVEHGFRALHLPIPAADISARKVDHLRTAEMLKLDYGISLDIAMPH
jgi:predicted HAD superfamily hydrolase